MRRAPEAPALSVRAALKEPHYDRQLSRVPQLELVLATWENNGDGYDNENENENNNEKLTVMR